MVLGRPDLGLIAIGIWTLSCIFIQMIRTETGEHLYGQRFTINPSSGDSVIAGIVDRMVAGRAWIDRPGT